MTSNTPVSTHNVECNIRTIAMVGDPSQIPVIASSTNQQASAVFTGQYLRYEGGYYRCSWSKNDHSMYRCFRYRPGGTTTADTASAADGGWTHYKSAKKNLEVVQ